MTVIRIICTVASLLLISVSVQCSDNSDVYAPYIGERYDDFDWNLMKVFGAPDYGNVLVSPVSIKIVLAMLYEGTTGAAERELQNVLQLPISRHATRDRFQHITASLQHPTFDMASRMFIDQNLKAQKRFSDILKTYYQTDIKYVVFDKAAQTADEINRWAENVTHGHVSELVNKDGLQNGLMVLANAVYYKGLWAAPFNRNATRDGIFTTAQNQRVIVPYMSNYGKYYYGESKDGNVQMLRLPYQDSNFSLFIVLPNPKIGLNNFIQSINTDYLNQLRWSMNQQEMFLYLPKFAFQYKSNMKNVLKTLGVKQIFENIESLPGVVDKEASSIKDVVLSDLIQKAGIEINEEGSTAWAATEGTIVNKFGSQDPVLNVSSPFMFCIEDELTGTIIFMGKIENPR